MNPWKVAETLLAKAKTPGDTAVIESLAKKLEPKLAKALLEAFDKLADGVDVEALAKHLASGNVGAAMSALGIDEKTAAFAGVKAALETGVWDAAAATAARIQDVTRLEVEFNRLNPALVDWLQGYEFKLIRETKKATKEAVQDVMIEGMKAGQNPRTVAREVKKIVGLTLRQRRAVRNFRKELDTFHLKRSAEGWNLGGSISRAPGGAQVYAIDDKGDPTDGIVERRLRDFRYDGTLQKAMLKKKPLTKKQKDAMVKAYTRKYLKYRAEVIARTEALRATNQGVQESWRQMIASGKIAESLVRRQWIVSKDERTCPICKPIPAMNPKEGVPFAVPFATPIGPVMLPPGTHPQCRCTVFIRFYEPVQIAAFTQGVKIGSLK